MSVVVAESRYGRLFAGCVDVKSRNKSSTGSRSSDRRNVLVFRRSDFSMDDDAEDKTPDEAPTSPASIDRGKRQSDSLPGDSAPSNGAMGGLLPSTLPSDDQIPSASCLPSASDSADQPSESGNLVGSSVETRDETALQENTKTDGQPSSPSAPRRSRSLTKGEIPKFYSLNMFPTPVKHGAAAKHAPRAVDKGRTNAARKNNRTVPAGSKKTATVSKKSAVKSGAGLIGDRRLTFVMKKGGDGKEVPTVAASAEATQTRRSARLLEDYCDDDVDDIMNQDDGILQDVSDVSGCSELFPDDDEDGGKTLVQSADDLSNLTLVPGCLLFVVCVCCLASWIVYQTV